MGSRPRIGCGHGVDILGAGSHIASLVGSRHGNDTPSQSEVHGGRCHSRVVVDSQRMPHHVCDDDAMFVLCAIPHMSTHIPTAPLQVLRTIGEASISRVPALGVRNAIYCAAVALVMVLWTPIWRITRNFITIVHEGGHALVAVLTGRRLEGVRLHADTSGVTVSTGRDRGIGLIMTCFAGYASPALFGLGCAAGSYTHLTLPPICPG